MSVYGLSYNEIFVIYTFGNLAYICIYEYIICMWIIVFQIYSPFSRLVHHGQVWKVGSDYFTPFSPVTQDPLSCVRKNKNKTLTLEINKKKKEREREHEWVRGGRKREGERLRERVNEWVRERITCP